MRLVAREHGRVRRKDDLLARRVHGVVQLHPVGRLLADQLDGREQRVALVEVVQVDLDAERPQRADAADAEDDLLRDARLARTAVKVRRRVGLGVARQVGVEQVQRGVAEGLGLPDLHAHVVALDGDGHLDAGVLDHVGAVRVGPEGVRGRPVGVDRLADIALPPQDAQPDERQAGVVRPLEVVAGEDAEPARVQLEGVVEAVLHAEVGDAGAGGEVGRHVEVGRGSAYTR